VATIEVQSTLDEEDLLQVVKAGFQAKALAASTTGGPLKPIANYLLVYVLNDNKVSSTSASNPFISAYGAFYLENRIILICPSSSCWERIHDNKVSSPPVPGVVIP